jgi:nucleotide-binding universal stress UspA family protein
MRNVLEQRVVVGVDVADHSTAAVDLAAAEADLRGLPLMLLSTIPRSNGAGSGTRVTALHRRICATWPGLATTARNVTGELAEGLIDASRGAGLVVVGRNPPPTNAPAARTAAARVAAQVAAHSRCPTLVVPTDTPASLEGPVLLGLGMSPDDDAPIAFAFEEAALRRVPLLVVHVWSGVPAAAVGRVSPFGYDLHQAQSAADRVLAETLAGWASKYPDVAVDRMPLYDANPGQTLLDASALAGLVVVGANHLGRHSSQLLGTVTRSLVEQATHPVAVVRPEHTA